MKKTIATVALMVSAASAHALIGPGDLNNRPTPVVKTICLALYEGNVDQGSSVGTCDETAANKLYKLELKKNKCAEGQVALVSSTIKIKSCPTYTQL